MPIKKKSTNTKEQGQLEQVNIRKCEIKNIRKELNRYGVKFSVMKDKANGDFVVFFQAKDIKMIDLASLV